jgi:hypothetical protein
MCCWLFWRQSYEKYPSFSLDPILTQLLMNLSFSTGHTFTFPAYITSGLKRSLLYKTVHSLSLKKRRTATQGYFTQLSSDIWVFKSSADLKCRPPCQYWVYIIEEPSNLHFDKHPRKFWSRWSWDYTLPVESQESLSLKFRDTSVPPTWKDPPWIIQWIWVFLWALSLYICALAKQPPFCPLPATGSIFSLFHIILDPFTGQQEKVSPGSKTAHSLASPSRSSLYQLIQAISASLIWHFEPTIPHMWGFMASH